MARRPRIDIPGFPQHVVQRGNNRAHCFRDDQDRHEYLALLGDALAETACRLHAYVLMPNHVHLLVTPPETGAVGKLMQKLGRRYVGWFNLRHGRTGTLWEGRYKSCLVDTDAYLLQCVRYIDLNPVRAGLTDDPVGYRWSSCAALCGFRTDPLLTPHAMHGAFGHPSRSPAANYLAFLGSAIEDSELQAIRAHLKLQRPSDTGVRFRT